MRQLLKSVDMTQTQAADFLGVSGRTVRRWVDGEWVAPRAVVMLFSLMIEYNLSRYEVEYLIQGAL